MADLPAPEPGLVIPYAYLWRHEHDKGLEEGRKTRPSVIVLSARSEANGAIRVTVVPLTHSPPTGDTQALELPPKVKQALKLDDQRSWIMLNEVNQFTWPGYDLRPVPGSKDQFAYGFIPPKLYDIIIGRILDGAAKSKVAAVPRD